MCFSVTNLISLLSIQYCTVCSNIEVSQSKYPWPLFYQEFVLLFRRWLSSSALEMVIFEVEVDTKEDLCDGTLASDNKTALLSECPGTIHGCKQHDPYLKGSKLPQYKAAGRSFRLRRTSRAILGFLKLGDRCVYELIYL